MVQNIDRPSQTSPFPASAPAANPVFYRTYSRLGEVAANRRETWDDVCDRTLSGIIKLGKLTESEADLLKRMQRSLYSMPSGRWLWVGGTEWAERPENFSGAYNCTSTNVVDWRAFGLMMDLAMMGCGTGAVLEPKYINQLPAIRNPLTVKIVGEIGTVPTEQRQTQTEVTVEGDRVHIKVGDSRQGWVASYQTLLELSTDERFSGEVSVEVDLSSVRPAGERLKGFGGMANPIRLPGLYERCARILNKAIGRQLNSVECCLLIDEAAACVVAGNIRRCLPEDALVHTAKGLVPIKDVQVGDRVQTPLGFRKVVNKFDQGFQNVYEIDTNGTAPRATFNHRIAVMADAQGTIRWTTVGDLVEGDRLMHNTQVLPGTLTQLPPDSTGDRPDQSHTVEPLTIPSLTPEVAWLIGFTHGNGSVVAGLNEYGRSYGRVEWNLNGCHSHLIEQLRTKLDVVLHMFGLTASYNRDSQNTFKAICHSIPLAHYFHRHVKQEGAALRVPDFILQGSVDVRAAYLAGLVDSDGVTRHCSPHLATTVYPHFARQVGVLLSSLGIAVRTTITQPQKDGWQARYNLLLVGLKERYNALVAPHSSKGILRHELKGEGFTLASHLLPKDHGWSQSVGMSFQVSTQVDINYEHYIVGTGTHLDIPVSVKGIGSYDYVQTYDIEVEETHCFYCDGYLTHNSAGMRQFDSEDTLAATAKDNLWMQDANGNWRIDPERDSLRMANHTRVFHRKPTLEECVEAVRKQFYSGEGAIQWAGEAIVHSNSDLLDTPSKKEKFINLYQESRELAKAYLKDLLLEKHGQSQG